jgi:hypothetical protein
MTDDIDAIRANHIQAIETVGEETTTYDCCMACQEPWPCDTARVLAVLEETRDAVRQAEPMFSLLRHRGGIRWGVGLPDPYDVDQAITKLRQVAQHGTPAEGPTDE